MRFQTHAHAHLSTVSREAPGGHTCAVRHAFASSINSLLALLLGSLELTVFTARTVPITAEGEQTGQSKSNISPAAHTTVMSQGSEDRREGLWLGHPGLRAGPPQVLVHLHVLSALPTMASRSSADSKYRQAQGDSSLRHLGVLGFH